MTANTYFDESLYVLSKTNFPTFVNKQAEVHKYLIDILNQYPDQCSDRMKNIYLKFLDRIDYEKLSVLVTKEFYNVEVMKTMSCLVNSVLTSEQDYIDYLTNPNVLKIDSKKMNLLVFFTSFLTGKDRILTFKYDKEDTLEEGMVGLLGLNSMRSIIPTFAWIYGFTKCNLPVFTKTGSKYEVVTACRDKVAYGEKNYIGMISEYIKGPTLYDYVKFEKPILQSSNVQEVGSKKLLSVLLTILYSLKYANEKIKYVHWDLHAYNVIMRELDTENSYIYLPDVDEYLWVGKHLATIIDYGLSSFEYNGVIISRYEYPEYGINPELTTSPLNDFFKLINSLYITTLTEYNKDRTNQITRENFKTVQEIFGLFVGTSSVDEIYKISNKSSQSYLTFPNAPKNTIEDFVQKTSYVTLDMLIKSIKKIASDKKVNIVTKNKPSVVFSCDKSFCVEEDMMEKLLLTRDEPLTLKEASQLSKRLDGTRNSDKKILDKFLVDYLDKIFNKISGYTNTKVKVGVDMIYLFNDLRIVENQLEILDTIARDTQNKELFDKIQKQKESIYKLINDTYDTVEKSLDQNESEFHRTTYSPEVQKRPMYLRLQSDFQDLVNKSKKPIQRSFSTKEEIKTKEKVSSPLKTETIVAPPKSETVVVPSKSMTANAPIFVPRVSSRSSVRGVQGPAVERVKVEPMMMSSIPVRQKERQIQETTTSSVPVARQDATMEGRKNMFMSQLKKYEQLLEGKKGVFIKSNLGKGKVQGMYNFIVLNKMILDNDPSLRAEIKKKMDLIKSIDDKYVDMIDGYMKQLSL